LLLLLVVAAFGLTANVTSIARADCADDFCDCLGEAGDYSLVATTAAKIRHGTISGSGSSYAVPTSVETSVCSKIGKIGGKSGGEADIAEDIFMTAATETAVKFKGWKYYGETYPGCFVGGDVATGGGAIKGEIYVEVEGEIDTSGDHPFVPECEQGLIDVATGSATLAALPPTQNLGDLIISDGNSYDINVGSGESSVIEVSKLIIKPLVEYGYPYGSTLTIHLDGTNTVVINVTEKFAVGSACQIIVEGGDVEDAIINVVGTGPTVRIARGALVTTPILAPGRKLVASVNSFCSNLIASKLIVKGATISEPMFCP
jgi:hypothetical protein